MGAFAGTACDILGAVGKSCAVHFNGLGNSIEIIEAADVESIPAPDAGTHEITTDIVLDATKVFYQWLIGDTDAEFNATPEGPKGNQTYRNTLTIFLPLTRKEVAVILNGMLNGEFVIRFGDKGGTKRLLGTDHSPAMIAEGGVQEVNNAERNGYTVTFENTGHMAYYYTGAAPLT